MRRAIILLLILTVGISCTKVNTLDVSYRVSPFLADSIPGLKVNMTFDANRSGTTILEYNNDAWGEIDLFNTLHHIALSNGEGVIEMDRDSGWIVVHHPRNMKQLELEYVLHQDFSTDISTDKVYRPIIQPEYFHVFSHNFFMVPKKLGEEISVSLEWQGFAKDFTIHNSFGSQERQQSLTIHKEEFGSAIFIGGDFRIYEDNIKGNAISLATRGTWIPFKEEEVMKVLKSTLACQRDFWDDHSQEYFTVTLQPFPQEMGSSFQGTGLTNSFATSVSNNEHTDIQQLVYLFNHELMHNWIGHTIQNENEEEQYWFSEGFTDYYTHKNIAVNRINALNASYFIDEINATIQNLFSSSVRNAPNSEINYDNFWSNQDYGKLAYYRGSIFAFYMDQTIRKDSNGATSLDDFMRQLLKETRVSGQKLSHDYFLDVAKEYMEDDFEAFFEAHILKGEDFDLAAIFDALGLEYSDRTKLYELGIELTQDRKGIAAVVRGSNAEKAGVKVGDRLFSRSIWYGSISKPVELGILRDGNEIEIAYEPYRWADVPTLINSKSNQAILMP